MTTQRIVNTHMQLRAAVASGLITERQSLALFPSHTGGAIPGPQDGWLLVSPFFSTDPTAAWYNHGSLWFGFHRFSSTSPLLPPRAARAAAKKAALQAAIAYCVTTYDLTDMVRNPLGDYLPAVVNVAFPIDKS